MNNSLEVELESGVMNWNYTALNKILRVLQLDSHTCTKNDWSLNETSKPLRHISVCSSFFFIFSNLVIRLCPKSESMVLINGCSVNAWWDGGPKNLFENHFSTSFRICCYRYFLLYVHQYHSSSSESIYYRFLHWQPDQWLRLTRFFSVFFFFVWKFL